MFPHFIGNIFSCFLRFVLVRELKMKKFTQQERISRLVMYDNIIDYLGIAGSTDEEIKQGKIIKKQIQKIADNFFIRTKKGK